MVDTPDKQEIKDIGDTLLEIAMNLLVSGASIGRIRKTVERISANFSFNTYILISQRTILLNMYDSENDCVFNGLKRTAPHHVNFTMISGISRISWFVVNEDWEIGKIKEELARVKSLAHYPRLVTLVLTGLAGASFCRLAGGGPLEMGVVFIASTAGLFIRQETTKLNFNPYLCIYFAALTASLIAAGFIKLDVAKIHEPAFATSVLFLIPGVPLINAFSDMIDGNLNNGLIRGINGFIISFTIALGLLTSMAILHF
ncbi:threonine/serine exporter family protein [Mucilaginibacter sp.]|uniref:threonine/serine ThrE exporter family protein n=1 Tax=Mucilaginibacter sp. TaxID=1882438 RepID=UPI00284683E4|nr:threonine/serine exporter family protein [Mucilaginibacter sp.]MDR3697439.1 threonine/serine exporter family protein [Mucilaginibacter sp.]